MKQSYRLFSVVAIFAAGFIAGVVFSAWKLDTGGGSAPPRPTHRTPARPGPEPAKPAVAPQPIAGLTEEAQALVREGRKMMQAAQYQKAAETFAAALEKSPDNPRVLTELGIAYRKQGKPKESVRVLRQAALADPDNAAALFNLGLVYHRQLNQPGEALKVWETFLERAGNTPFAVMVRPWVEKLREQVEAGQPTQ